MDSSIPLIPPVSPLSDAPDGTASLFDIERLNTKPWLKKYIKGLEFLKAPSKSKKSIANPLDNDEALLSNYFWSGYGMFLSVDGSDGGMGLLSHYNVHRWHPLDQAKVYLELENRLYKIAYGNGLAFNEETTRKLLSIYDTILKDKMAPKPIKKIISSRVKIIKGKHRTSFGLDSSKYEFPLLYHTGLKITPAEIIKMGKQEIERLTSLLIDRARVTHKDLPLNTKQALIYLRYHNTINLNGDETEKVRVNAIYPANFSNNFTPEVADYVNMVIVSKDSKLDPYVSIWYDHSILISSHQTPITEAVIYNKTIPGEHLRHSTNPDYLVNTLMKEGWNAYAESLPTPLNYNDVLYSNLTHTAIMVVDASLHSGLMTREDALGYLKRYTLLSDEEMNQTLLHSSQNPGYLVCPKLGRSVIEEYRDKIVSKSLTLPKFHSTILSSRNVGELVKSFDWTSSYAPTGKTAPREEYMELVKNLQQLNKTSSASWVTWFLVVSSSVIVLLLVVVVVLLFLNFFKVGPKPKTLEVIRYPTESSVAIDT